MANIKSAKKRIKVARTRTMRNKAVKTRVKNVIKAVDQAIMNNDKEAAIKALKEAVSVINRAGSKGVFHKNTCSRKVARLSKAVAKIQ